MTSPSAPRRLPTWREMNRDTDPQAEAVLFALWRETSAWGKLRMMGALNRSATAALLARLRERHPTATTDELQRLLAGELLGPELAAQVYGPLPAGGEDDDRA